MIIEYLEDGRPTAVMGTYVRSVIGVLEANGVRFIEVMGELPFDALTNGRVEDGALLQRANMGVTIDRTDILADGVDQAVISDIPLGAIVEIDGVPVEHPGSTLPLSSDMPATYSILIEKWPFLPFEAEVTAS